MKSLFVLVFIISSGAFAAFNEDCKIAVKDLNAAVFSQELNSYAELSVKYDETIETCREVFARTSEESAADFISSVEKMEKICNKNYNFSYAGAKLEALGCKAQELDKNL